MKHVKFHPDAGRELTEAQAWYRERSDVAAQALALEIDRAIKSIAETPERWPMTSRGLALSSHGFHIRFFIESSPTRYLSLPSLTKAGVPVTGTTASRHGPNLAERTAGFCGRRAAISSWLITWFSPDAWIDTSRRDEKDGQVGIVGYEINFNRYFYRYTPPRPLEEIKEDIRAIEKDIVRMLAEVTGST